MIIALCIIVMLCCVAYLIYKRVAPTPIEDNFAKQPGTNSEPDKETCEYISTAELFYAIQEANRHLSTIKTIMLILFTLSIVGVVAYIISIINLMNL